MNSFRLTSFLFGISLFLSSASFGQYDFEFPRQLNPYVGRIVVSNTSKEIVEVYLHGDQCQFETKVSKKVLRACQSMFLQPGEQSTFFLDGKNVRNSRNLWLVMKYPDSVWYSTATEWLCHDRDMKKRVDGISESIPSVGFTTVEIRDTFVQSTSSVSCILRVDPNSI